MKASNFTYHRPDSIEETVALLGGLDGTAALLAGGQSLLPALFRREISPTDIVDLNFVAGLDAIDPTGGGLTLGAMTRQTTALRSGLVRERAPLLHAALGEVGHPETRTRGTVGGSAAQALAVAEIPAVLLALEATLHLRSNHGSRRLSAADFFAAEGGTAAAPDELLTGIELEPPPPRTGSAFEELRLRRYEFPLLSIAAQVTVARDGSIHELRLAFSGMAPSCRRARATERELCGARLSDEALDRCPTSAVSELEPGEDVHADAEYRRHAATKLARRVVERAWREALEAAA